LYISDSFMLSITILNKNKMCRFIQFYKQTKHNKLCSIMYVKYILKMLKIKISQRLKLCKGDVDGTSFEAFFGNFDYFSKMF